MGAMDNHRWYLSERLREYKLAKIRQGLTVRSMHPDEVTPYGKAPLYDVAPGKHHFISAVLRTTE